MKPGLFYISGSFGILITFDKFCGFEQAGAKPGRECVGMTSDLFSARTFGLSKWDPGPLLNLKPLCWIDWTTLTATTHCWRMKNCTIWIVWTQLVTLSLKRLWVTVKSIFFKLLWQGWKHEKWTDFFNRRMYVWELGDWGFILSLPTISWVYFWSTKPSRQREGLHKKWGVKRWKNVPCSPVGLHMPIHVGPMLLFCCCYCSRWKGEALQFTFRKRFKRN